MAHLRATSPLLKRPAIALTSTPEDPLQPIRSGVDALLALNPEQSSTTFLSVLKCVADHQLFEIPTALLPFVLNEPTMAENEQIIDDETDSEGAIEKSPASLEAWRAFLETPYNQTIPFSEYVSENGPLNRPQFPRLLRAS